MFSKWVEEARPDLDNGRPDHIFKGFGIAKTTRLWYQMELGKLSLNYIYVDIHALTALSCILNVGENSVSDPGQGKTVLQGSKTI